MGAGSRGAGQEGGKGQGVLQGGVGQAVRALGMGAGGAAGGRTSICSSM